MASERAGLRRAGRAETARVRRVVRTVLLDLVRRERRHRAVRTFLTGGMIAESLFLLQVICKGDVFGAVTVVVIGLNAIYDSVLIVFEQKEDCATSNVTSQKEEGSGKTCDKGKSWRREAEAAAAATT